MDKLKYVKLENPDGSYSDNIPLAIDSDYVDVNGKNLTNELKNKADIQIVDKDIQTLSEEISIQKTRIDNLASLEEGSTTGDAELIDARINDYGKNFNSVGDNIRDFMGNTKNVLTKVDGEIFLKCSRYEWNFVDEENEPEVGTVKACIHNTVPIFLKKGSLVSPLEEGVKWRACYKNIEDNLFYSWIGLVTEERLIPADGYYYFTFAYTPERNIPDTENDRAILSSKIKITSIDNIIHSIDSLKSQSSIYMTGLNEKSRFLLKTILENAVFTKDIKDLIIELDGELAEKGKIIINQANKAIIGFNQSTNQIIVRNSEEMSILKRYYLSSPGQKKITFFIANGGRQNAELNMLILYDENNEYHSYFQMNNSGRWDKEWTANRSSSEKSIGSFDLCLYNEYIENSYAYETETGNIIFAGDNTKYAGKINIYT